MLAGRAEGQGAQAAGLTQESFLQCGAAIFSESVGTKAEGSKHGTCHRRGAMCAGGASEVEVTGVSGKQRVLRESSSQILLN